MMLTSTHYDPRTSTALPPGSGSGIARPQRLARLRRLGLTLVAVLAIASAAGIGAEGAFATTQNLQDKGGNCSYLPGSNVTVSSGRWTWSAPTATKIYRWTRLVDVNGNAQTGWSPPSSGWAYPGYPVTFGKASIDRSGQGKSSRIQSYYAFYVNDRFNGDAYVTTTWYTTLVYVNPGWSSGTSTSSCFL